MCIYICVCVCMATNPLPQAFNITPWLSRGFATSLGPLGLRQGAQGIQSRHSQICVPVLGTVHQPGRSRRLLRHGSKKRAKTRYPLVM